MVAGRSSKCRHHLPRQHHHRGLRSNQPHHAPRPTLNTPGTAQAQTYPNFVAALGNPQFSKLRGVVGTLGLDKTFSNPQLKVTVFVPNDAVGGARAGRAAASRAG